MGASNPVVVEPAVPGRQPGGGPGSFEFFLDLAANDWTSALPGPDAVQIVCWRSDRSSSSSCSSRSTSALTSVLCAGLAQPQTGGASQPRQTLGTDHDHRHDADQRQFPESDFEHTVAIRRLKPLSWFLASGSCKPAVALLPLCFEGWLFEFFGFSRPFPV